MKAFQRREKAEKTAAASFLLPTINTFIGFLRPQVKGMPFKKNWEKNGLLANANI